VSCVRACVCVRVCACVCVCVCVCVRVRMTHTHNTVEVRSGKMAKESRKQHAGHDSPPANPATRASLCSQSATAFRYHRDRALPLTRPPLEFSKINTAHATKSFLLFISDFLIPQPPPPPPSPHLQGHACSICVQCVGVDEGLDQDFTNFKSLFQSHRDQVVKEVFTLSHSNQDIKEMMGFYCSRNWRQSARGPGSRTVICVFYW
jgi:hypothetical protein